MIQQAAQTAAATAGAASSGRTARCKQEVFRVTQVYN